MAKFYFSVIIKMTNDIEIEADNLRRAWEAVGDVTEDQMLDGAVPYSGDAIQIFDEDGNEGPTSWYDEDEEEQEQQGAG
jgi:hypothetical protein